MGKAPNIEQYTDNGGNVVFAFMDDEPNQAIGVRLPGDKQNHILTVHNAIGLAKLLLDAACDYRFDRVTSGKSTG
jgi:hypothetical protein